jgi:hypothetical protein
MKIGEKYFMRERVISKQLLMQFLCSKDQIVDIMNKALTAPRFGCLKNKLTFAPAPSTCGGAVKQQMELSNSTQLEKIIPAIHVTNILHSSITQRLFPEGLE